MMWKKRFIPETFSGEIDKAYFNLQGISVIPCKKFVNYFSSYKGFFDEEFPGLENCYSVELRREVDDFIHLIQIR